MTNIDALLTRGVTNIIPNKDKLKKLLSSDKKLNIYLGIDPTSTKIHLGHAVPLRKLAAFADLGHNVTFLIGDFTALIGDTSDKDGERPHLTSKQIQKNFKTYKSQAEKIINFEKIKVVHNSDWLAKLSFEEIIKLCQNFSLGDFTSRELIKKRLTSGKKVGLHEALYPVMQGYDSYHLKTDIQIGAADQTFNMQAGRTLHKKLRNKESFILVVDYLEGTDGRKMSKTWDNAIWIEDEPNQMFGKVMSMSDSVLEKYFTLATNLETNKFPDFKNPLNAKLALAHQIVSELHSKADADKAKKYFQTTFQNKQTPKNIPQLEASEHKLLVEAVHRSEIVKSRSEAKRLIKTGAVDINDKTIKDPKHELIGGENIKIGKKHFIKIKG